MNCIDILSLAIIEEAKEAENDKEEGGSKSRRCQRKEKQPIRLRFKWPLN